MLLARQYLRMSLAPPEREPTPDSFQPAYGTGYCKTFSIALLMFTDPVAICLASVIPLALSRVHTLPDSP